MAQTFPIPSAVERAYAILKVSGICELTGNLEAPAAGRFQFGCRINVPHPNPSGLPATVMLTGFLRDTFPLTPVDFYPSNDSGVRGFPHQDAETHKLCLPPEFRAAADDQRMVTYVTWAREWLHDAANGALLAAGDPYELPDFSCKCVKEIPATVLSMYTDETPATFASWQHRIGHTGIVELSMGTRPSGLFIRRFLTQNHEVIRTTAFSETLFGKYPVLKAAWILLPGLTVERHRPAQTIAELTQLCTDLSVSFDRTLKQAWRGGDRHDQFGVLVVGFPIPRTVGAPISEIHWQPFLLPNHEATRRSFSKYARGKGDEGRLWHFARNDGVLSPTRRIRWGKVENIATIRQVARGGQPTNVQKTRFAVFGCGAIGSLLTETLVRGGVGEIALFDSDVLDFGNLCRHTLDGRDVQRCKASALADRLRGSFPTARVSNHDIDAPWSEMARERFAPIRSLEQSDVIIDCTTDHNAFLWLSSYARKNGKRLASLFVNPYATLLTLVLSGRQTPGNKVFRRLVGDIEAGLATIDPAIYFAELSPQDQVMPGAGCWHPTFPAAWPHIGMLVFATLGHLARWIEEPPGCDGSGILIRRHEAGDVGPVVETLFKKAYR